MKFQLFPHLSGMRSIDKKPKKRFAPWESMFDDMLQFCFLDFSPRQSAETQNAGGGHP